MRVCLFITASAVFALSLAPNLVLAPPPPASATCNISCTVVGIAEWSDTSSPTINLPDLTTQNSQVSAGTPLMLYTNGDVEINFNNSVSTLIESPYGQLSKDDNHKLITEYMLKYHTDGTTTVWSNYRPFLNNDSTVKHISGNAATGVTLSARISNDSRSLGDSGGSNATLTLTVCWKS